jgi:hypothetical protein
MKLELVLTIVLTSAAVLITWIITHYYYKKGIRKKSLTPFLDFYLELFSDIDKNLREDLMIKYKNVLIDNFFQVQFIIVNTGNEAIHDCIKPLKLNIPRHLEILDTKIVYVNPKGREVIIEKVNKNSIEFQFPLLNKKEYFITRILIKGEVKKSEIENEFIFSITAPDLPSNLKTLRPLPHDKSKRNKLNFDAYFFSLMSINMIVLMGYLISLKNQILDVLNNKGIELSSGLYITTIVAIIMISLVFLFTSIMVIITNFKNRKLDIKNRLKIPMEF